MLDLERFDRARAVSIGSFLFLAGAIGIVATTPPAAGYEASLYGAYPWYFWLLVVLATLAGCAVILDGAFGSGRGDGRWRVGFLAVLLVDGLLLFLPATRGYAIYGRADALTHIGFMRSILETGSFGSRNIYPALHDLGLTVAYVTGLSLDSMVNLLPPLFSLFSVLAVYALATRTFDDRHARFVLPFGSLLVFSTGHLNFAPFVQSALLVPFVLYLYFKYRDGNDPRVFAVLVLVIIAIVLYHPLTTVFLVLAFAVAYPLEQMAYHRAVSFNVAAVAGIVFGLWYFGFVGILRMVSTTVYNLAYAAGQSDLEEFSQVVSQTSPRLEDLAQIAVLKYGFFMVGSVFVGACVLYLAHRYWRHRVRPPFATSFLISAYVLFGALSTVFFVNAVVGGFGRPLAFAKVFAVLLTGLFFGLVARRQGRPHVGSGVRPAIAIVLVALVLISTFSLYPSPLMKEQNRQTTQMDLEGTDWAFEHLPEEREIIDVGINPQRYYERSVGARGFRSVNTGGSPPSHFGYINHATLGGAYPNVTTRYLLITEFGRATYPEVFPEYEPLWRYTPEDFRRLERDPTVHHLYDNGEFDGYAVRTGNRTVTQ